LVDEPFKQIRSTSEKLIAIALPILDYRNG